MGIKATTTSASFGKPKTSVSKNAGLALLALGVVFGDIGTSPLYAFETALTAAGGSSVAAMGVASLIFWALILVVTVKYGFLVMRADYQGEGGIFALFALLQKRGALKQRFGKWMILGIVFGAALLFGDGAITPAISVLSALEGLEAIHPTLEPVVLPGAAAILALLFFIQRFGTGNLGVFFGPVMALWFVAIGVLGFVQILHAPEVLKALNPLVGAQLLSVSPAFGMAVVGAVVLAVTGAEALYADMGHFGRSPIVFAWRFVALPALVLNYFGQAAFVLRNETATVDPNLFFLLAPIGGLREGMVVLATLATIIASQALISGVFSLTSQAIDLGYLPRFFVKHTSASSHGQIYIPSVNFLLGAVCLLLVLGFRSSSALANAYGIAVTGAMILTSMAFVLVSVLVRGWAPWKGGIVLVGLLALDLPLFVSCLSKLLEGGVFPIVIAVGIAVVMLTWRKGRDLVRHSMRVGAVTLEELSQRLVSGEFLRTPVTQVFIVRKPEPALAIAEILEQHRRLRIVAENIVILLLEPEWSNPRSPAEKVTVVSYPGNLWLVRAAHGYMALPDAPAILDIAMESGLETLQNERNEMFYVVTRDLVFSGGTALMPGWQRALYSILSRNVLLGPNYLNIPAERLVIFGWMLRA